MIPDKRFIENPDNWPQWPYLPMKNPKRKDLVGGTIIDNQSIGAKIDKNHESLRTVILCTIWCVAAKRIKFHEAEKKVYDSVDAMLADGWMVD